MKKAFICCAFLLLHQASQAEIYKCVVNGKVTFSDQVCSDSAQKISVKPATGSAENAAANIAEKNANKGDAASVKKQLHQEIRKSEKLIQQLQAEQSAKVKQLIEKKRQADPKYRPERDSELQELQDEYSSKVRAESEKIKRLSDVASGL